MLAQQVKACQAIQENRIDTKDRYKYRKTCIFRKNSISKISNSSQPLIEESINWQTSNSVSKRTSKRS